MHKVLRLSFSQRLLVCAFAALLLFFPAADLLAQVPQLLNYQGRVAVGTVNFNGTGQFKFALVDGGGNASVQATAIAVRTGGFITSVNVTNGGIGYASPPPVSFTGGGGSGATATATLAGGVVTGITVTNAGSGYTSTPAVNIAAPPATFTATFWSNDGSSGAGSEPTNAVSLTVTSGLYSVLLGDTSLAGMTTIPASVWTNADVRLRVWFDDGTNGSQLLTPDQRIAAVGYAMIAGNVQDGAITSAKITSGAVGSAQLAANAVQSTNIAAGAAAANLDASGQSGVASGGMVLSSDSNATLLSAGYVKLGRVDLGNVWEPRATGGAPAARYLHTAVWTGSEMIVWGGSNVSFLNDGGRYNPSANSWTAVTTTGAPAARNNHTAVWTGSEMIVWGGFGGSFSGYFSDTFSYTPSRILYLYQRP